eukprot:TRINITY_DN41878_c0_g1_i3.p2 TRINITY_DN41878_c0_g1~~TRINITY_DN41878_c0_g1_i3.p2  ORF type:complete len:211 (+),score=27.83 TRINITY_DN41878_c0_g1_i3:40-633(+)
MDEDDNGFGVRDVAVKKQFHYFSQYSRIHIFRVHTNTQSISDTSKDFGDSGELNNMFLLLQLVAVFVTTSLHSQQNTGSQSQDYPTDYEYEFTYEDGGLESSSFFVLAADEGPNSTEYIELFQDIKEEVLATNIELFSRGQYVEEDLQSFSDEEAQPISEDAAEEFSLEENGGISIRVIQDTQSAGKRTAEIPPGTI